MVETQQVDRGLFPLQERGAPVIIETLQVQVVVQFTIIGVFVEAPDLPIEKDSVTPVPLTTIGESWSSFLLHCRRIEILRGLVTESRDSHAQVVEELE
jgi:hypothetical protein